MALRLQEIEPRLYEFCITPTGRELPVMTEHWKHLECLLGQSLVRVPGPTLIESIVRNKTLPNWHVRFCTREVKIEPFQAYSAAKAPVICYVGIRADEVGEREGTRDNIEGVNQEVMGV